MIVALSKHNNRAKAEPVGYLPRPVFEKYRVTCEGAAAVYDSTVNGNVISLENLPKLMELLTAAGFEPRVAPDLEEALRLRAEVEYVMAAEAAGRVNSVGAALAKHGLSLYPFQVLGVQWLAPRRSGLLCDDPGLGKTIQGLAAAPAGALLVIAPAPAKGVWLREALRWRPDYQPTVLSGRGSFRWPVDNEMFITNPAILPPIEGEDADGELIKLHPYMDCPAGLTVIVDEAHAFKSHKTKQTQSLRKLLKAVWAAGGRTWAATGTPLINKREELASLLTTFGLFQEAFGTWTRYLRVMSGTKAHWGGYEWGEPTPAAIEGLKRVMLRRRREEVLPDLPTKTYEAVPVAVDASTRDACMEAQALLDASGVSLEGAIFETQSLGMAFEQISKLRKALATAKLPALLALLPEYEEAGEPVLVFSAHRPPIDALAQRPGWAVITGDTPAHRRTELENLFQAGELKGLALTIQAGGVAITLTKAHQAIFVDLAWTPALNQQAEDRICRIGQTRGVVIKTLTVLDSIDEDVIALLRAKQAIIDSTVNAAAIKTQGELP